MFGRSKKPPLESEDLRRMGRLEAAVETLELKWEGYRDELKKLVSRLEKRDQRAEQKLRAAASQDEETPSNGNNDISEIVDPTSARVLARRANRGIRE